MTKGGNQKTSADRVVEALRNFGLTEKEAGTYIFLARNGAQKSAEIAKKTKIQRAEVYRVLKNLQAKGIVQPTLEAPTRFTASPFETVVDSFIKKKREEALSIEKAKEDLLRDWGAIGETFAETRLEKFVVIEGRQRIYSKILEMANRSMSQFSAIATPQALVRLNQFGIVDAALSNPFRSRVQFRLITEIPEENLTTIKSIFNRSKEIDLQSRTPELGFELYPQMAIRDREEAIFFTKSQVDLPPAEQDNNCLWTDCKSLVLAFQRLFDESWNNSRESREQITWHDEKITQLNPSAITAETWENYSRLMKKAQKEVLIMISSRGLLNLARDVRQLKEWNRRGVAVRILAPLTKENSEAANLLSACCEIKHAPSSYLDSTIIDGSYLFQFKNTSTDSEVMSYPVAQGAFYSTDTEHIGKTRQRFNELWKAAQSPSITSLQPTNSTPPSEDVLRSLVQTKKRIVDVTIENENYHGVTAQEIIDKVIAPSHHGKKHDGAIKQFGFAGQAIVHYPVSLDCLTCYFTCIISRRTQLVAKRM